MVVVVQTNSTQSAKICTNLHFRGEGQGGGDGGVPDQLNPQSAKIYQNLHFGGRGWWPPPPTQPKVPRSVQICIFGGGRVVVQRVGHSRNFEPKILATGMCSASQIVSHILRVWRLMNPARRVFCISVVAEKGVFYQVDAFPVCFFNLAKYRILQLPIYWKQQIIT